MPNILYECLTTIQSALQSGTPALTSAELEVASIPTTAVVIRKTNLREEDFKTGHLLEEMPGILIVPGPTRIVQGHHSLRDAKEYSVDLVICDRDNNQLTAGLSTYIQWQQNISQYFHHRTSGWPSNASGIVWLCQAKGCETVNDWRWVKHREAVSGVQLTLHSLEPRG